MPVDTELLIMRTPGTPPWAGSLYRNDMHRDSQWHIHDIHQILYTFEGAIEVESDRGRNLIRRQLAAWIPTGVHHCASIHGVRWVSIFFTTGMLIDTEQCVRTVMASPLTREIMREAMRWPMDRQDDPLPTAFFDAMSKLCGEWISHEANLFLPTSKDPRVKRVLDYTTRRMDLNLEVICQHAGMSVRSLRRHLKDETGMIWDSYRHRSRLLQAISLLSETDEPISEIAPRYGFETQSAFAKVFRLEMGEAPSYYRARASNPA